MLHQASAERVTSKCQASVKIEPYKKVPTSKLPFTDKNLPESGTYQNATRSSSVGLMWGQESDTVRIRSDQKFAEIP